MVLISDCVLVSSSGFDEFHLNAIQLRFVYLFCLIVWYYTERPLPIKVERGIWAFGLADECRKDYPLFVFFSIKDFETD